MAEFKITIDARGIFDPTFSIHPTKNPANRDKKTDTPQSVLLAPGTYTFQVHSCTSTLKFTVTPEGALICDNPCAHIESQDPPRLRVSGFKVTLDATYVGMRGALGVLLGGGSEAKWIERETLRLIPGTYRVGQGSALVSSFIFRLLTPGVFDYEEDYDLSKGGFLEGRSTPTLAFRGYPFLVDASRLGGAFRVGFSNVNGLPLDMHVLFANLLPMNAPFRIGVGAPNDASTNETGLLGVNIGITPVVGQIELLDKGDLYTLARDTFHGLARLTLRKK